MTRTVRFPKRGPLGHGDREPARLVDTSAEDAENVADALCADLCAFQAACAADAILEGREEDARRLLRMKPPRRADAA